MTAEILATGSSGNVTAIRTQKLLLVDCGKAARWILQRLNYALPDAILVTHEHGDHSRAASEFLKRGVEIFMTRGTAEALNLRRHNLRLIAAGEKFMAADVTVEAIPSTHDAAEPVNFILADAADRLLYVTDTGEPPNVTGTFTKILLEANYATEILMNAPIPLAQRQRIFANHLSTELAERFLRQHPAAEVRLIHRSKRHIRE